ncbi:MAG TPA: multiprotein-bridging factor 1 family protein [bacterium]|nr:multiprotein-bridging factor 1 family protein [bacterium]
MPSFCEMCGRMSNEALTPINHYGEKLFVCKQCLNNEKRKYTQKQGEQSTLIRMRSWQSPAIREPDYDIIDNYFQIVKEAREKNGATIPELALKVGIKESVLRRIEAGRLQPDIETAKKLERFLHVTLLTKRENTQLLKPSSQGESGLELRHVAKLKDFD